MAPICGVVAVRLSLRESFDLWAHSDDFSRWSGIRMKEPRGGVCERGARSNAADEVESYQRKRLAH